MSSYVPESRPRITRDEAIKVANSKGVFLNHVPFVVIGIRGYYLDTMGKVGENDRGICDDALLLLADDGTFKTFNGNTDPSRIRRGAGEGATKGMAMLKEGCYRVHRCALHRNKYEALCQRGGPVVVTRDGITEDYDDKGMFGINIHKAGSFATHSEGCQTVYPDQWDEFIGTVHAQVKRIAGKHWREYDVTYLLIDKDDMDAALQTQE